MTSKINAKGSCEGKASRRAPKPNNPANLVEPGTASATPPTKLQILVDLLSRPDGATLDVMANATGWQTHSIRGALAGSLKRKGHVITSKTHDGQRCYRIEART